VQVNENLVVSSSIISAPQPLESEKTPEGANLLAQLAPEVFFPFPPSKKRKWAEIKELCSREILS
jgi:hypothetical protein